MCAIGNDVFELEDQASDSSIFHENFHFSCFSAI